MQRRFDKALTSLEGRQPVLMAVSGGIDSMTMADLFLGVRSGPEVAVAHCNFHLRGKESDADEEFVRKWAAEHEIRFHKADFDTEKYARSHGMSLEMAARKLRYTWFALLCAERGYAAVAVAHQADDNAETLILNLLRGTGIRGAAGMRPVSNLPVPGSSVPLVRPLLAFSRAEIREYALSRKLTWREDRTNAGTDCKRNCIRNEIFPLFKKLNPSFLSALNGDMERFAQVGDIADDFLSFHSDTVLEYSGEDRHPAIDIRRLLSVPHWEYLLFRILEQQGFSSTVSQEVAHLLKAGGTVGGKTFTGSGKRIVTTSETLDIGPSGEVEEVGLLVPGPGEYRVSGKTIQVRIAPPDRSVPFGPVSGATCFDSGKLAFPIFVRNWQEGDWMRPMGLKNRSGKPGRKKISDLFTDLKFSLPDKAKALVIAGEGSRVFALLGFRIDDSVKVTEATASVTSIRFI